MAEAAASPPPLETKVGYSADGKRVVLTCSMRVPDICSAPSKRAYTRNKKGRLLWQAELGCYYCSRCLAHTEGHAARIAAARHPACHAPMCVLAISSGIPGGARPAVRHGAVTEGHQSVSQSIPTAPNSY